MTRPPWPARIAVVVAVGAVCSLAAGAVSGMAAHELGHLAILLAPAAVVTLAVAVLARPLLERLPTAGAVVTVAAVAAAASVANVSVLARLMFVSHADAIHLIVLVAYAVAVGTAAALAMARRTQAALTRLAETAAGLRAGRLDVRAGPLPGPRELRTLGGALDEMAARLDAALGRERELEARRRDLVAAASHDLRTPLASLRAMLEAIGDGVVEDPETLRRYVREMRRAVEGLSGLVDDLFQLAQLDAGALAEEGRRATVAEVADAALRLAAPQAAARGVELARATAEIDGEACSPRLAAVLQTLLQNAVRHTPSGGTVRLVGRRAGGGLELSVEDTGEGIPHDQLERVFEPFWRGDPARTPPGAGLGLALARRIVEALGGRIEASSAPAHGARFAVFVPR